MPSVLSKYAGLIQPKHVATTAAVVTGVYLIGFTGNYNDTGSNQRKPVFGEAGEGKTKEKAQLDGVFLRRILKILKILVPGWFTAEVGYLTLVGVMLLLRTRFDVWMIANGTAIESSIIDRDRSRFIKYLFKYIYAQPTIALTNQLLKYGLNSLKLRFRKRFTMYMYDQYLQGHTYYKMSNIDNRIANADQLLTQDLEKFCNSLVDLYSNLSKPLLDIVIYIYRLTGTIGAQGPAIMISYLVFSGLVLNRMRRPIGKLTVSEQRFEGEYRYVNSRLITNSEEIAFYNGNEKEKHIIVETFQKLYKHLLKFIHFRFRTGIVDDLIAKYTATTFGYLIVSRPFLDLAYPKFINASHTELLEDYYRSGRMLVRLSQAIGRIVLAGREMSRLAGFTARVTDLIKVTDELNNGVYQRTMVHQSSESSHHCLAPGNGTIHIEDNIIQFDKVPLVTPNGDVLIHEMNFKVPSGVNVIICGPNGCGKSSLFRVLGELWPLFGGKLTKPHRSKLFYIPQRPYMTLGSLRDQVIYPDSVELMKKKGWNDQDLEDYLKKVQLENILVREGGWDSVQDWMDVLSGGEKQRMAMARLFYHKPQFAILDECTSAVSVDVEGFMYQHCREVGITLFTVSHRKSLWRHHEYFLHMDGRGNYEFDKIEGSTVEFGS
uniref:ATP-binding cassette sub-family D member 3-like n=1 Tax=Ciona intestinalis TaxID=7719 RepID=F6WF19_CIOIN|nr:ATP-binding cassette sub-family D member 3-like [Ciona intestinalis]|eukprot:XP_002124998.1 ATP-binding cassette sub-family D member 3-like [Ciona intestinalis]